MQGVEIFTSFDDEHGSVIASSTQDKFPALSEFTTTNSFLFVADAVAFFQLLANDNRPFTCFPFCVRKC